MKLSIPIEAIAQYTQKQLETFFPDGQSIPKEYNAIVKRTMIRVEYCFQWIKLDYFKQDAQPYFNHLNADHYTMYLYFLSNTAYIEYGESVLATKCFYLNKVLHSFHCMYDTVLPDIFLIIHGSGTVLGKAQYDDFFVVMHNVTVGSNAKWESPKIGKHVTMYPNSSILGLSTIADGTCLANGTMINNSRSREGEIIFGRSPDLIAKRQYDNKSDIYFEVHKG